MLQPILLRRPVAAGLLALSLLLPGATVAQRTVPGPIEQMKPGDALIAPTVAPDGPVTVLVSLPQQRAYVYRNGVPIAVSTVSTGKRGHETPTGIFTILQKDADHRSSIYHAAPMPFMQRLTWDGVALHAGNLPGYPASHGCVRLPRRFAQWLFTVTRPGATVIITDAAIVPEIAPSAMPLVEPPPDGHQAASGFAWHPDLSPRGPVSLVLSGRDRRLVVLRNGVEIGSAPIGLDAPVEATAAFVLTAPDAPGGPAQWLRLPMPGDAAAIAPGEVRYPVNDPRAHLPAGFREQLATVLRPGTTLLVTRETLATAGTGTRLRVFDTRR